MGIFDFLHRNKHAAGIPEQDAVETVQEAVQDYGHAAGIPMQKNYTVGAGRTDPEDYQFRPLAGSLVNDPTYASAMLPLARKVGRQMYYGHAVGGALPEMLVDRILGTGFGVKAANKKVQKIAEAFISDPHNDLQTYLPQYAMERWGVYGELFLPIYLTPTDASVRLGYLHPDCVTDVIWDSGDHKRPIAVLQAAPEVGGKRLLWIIPYPDVAEDNRFAPHPALTTSTEADAVIGKDGLPVQVPDDPQISKYLLASDTEVAGYLFYHRSNCLVSGRGWPIYERIKSWLKAADDFLFGTLKAAILQRIVLWHVRVNGDDKAVEKRQAQLRGVPKSGTVLVTNNNEEWEAKVPAVTPATAIHELLGAALRMVGISTAIPEHELGGSADSNRATAKEAASISTARAKRMQQELAAMVLTWLSYQIDQKVHRGMLPKGVDRTVEIILPELDAEDEGEVATAVKTGVEAMVAAMSAPEPLVLPEDARALVYSLMGRDVPDPEKFAALKAEIEARKAAAAPPALPARPVMKNEGPSVKDPEKVQQAVAEALRHSAGYRGW